MLKSIKIYAKNHYLEIISALFILFSVMWALMAQSIEPTYIVTQILPTDKGFTQIIDDEIIPLDSLRDVKSPSNQSPLVLETTIPTLYHEQTFMFYTKDVEVELFLDGVSIYSSKTEEPFSFLKTNGNQWHCIHLDQSSNGSTLRLVLNSNFEYRYEFTLSHIYFIDQSQCLTVMLNNDFFRIIMTFIMIFMTFWSYINGIIWKSTFVRPYFFRLGGLLLCTALWLASMSGIFSYFFKSTVAAYLLSMIMSNYLPVMAYGLLCSICRHKHNVLLFLEKLVWGNFIGQMILQFVFHVSLLDLLPITYIVYAIGALISIIYISHHIFTYRKDVSVPLVSLSIFLVAALVEITVLCIYPERTELIGVAGTIGMFFYLLINHFSMRISESRINTEKLELEETYHKLQATTLMQQIKAHFFFNTLNTISAICKYDAQEADHAISIFAQYMHSYMKLINMHTPIPFIKELEILEATLTIEQLRFPDNFTYEIDLDYTDFFIPPLSIQPIVENSMIHGLRTLDADGKICIKTKKNNHFIQIIVSDNGVGFDVTLLNKEKSIGLTNLKNRLALMVNGTMSIQSQPSVGTQTTISIPLPQPPFSFEPDNR